MRTVPDLLTFSLATPETLLHLAPSDDGNFSTHTSREQYITEKSILQLLQSYGPPTGIPLRELTLHRQKHIDWLLIGLERLSAGFTTLDASRPWIVYWIVNSLDLLGFEFPDGLIDRIIETLARFQCPTGGFCGGPGQLPHLATTYASVNVLAILATPKAYRIIDRDSMFSFFLSLKQADGSFIMHEGGEIDVRGSYCVLSVAYMLDLLTPRLTDGISDFILKCQSYEGGFSGSPGVEAHGGYSFCAVAALEILGKVPQCNLDGLVRWSASRHMKVEGGFSGRANKLVDGCYSFWCGSLYPIIEKNLRALGRVQGDSTIDLMNRECMQLYLLTAGQHPRAGLRDKPSKSPDYYHTCYCISGLSVSQHYYDQNWTPTARKPLGSETALFPVHPVFGVCVGKESLIQHWFRNKHS